MNIQLHIGSDNLSKKEWEILRSKKNYFLSLHFNKAFEEHHQKNIKHLYYILRDGKNKGIGYAQQFNIRGTSIHNYKKKNNVKVGFISFFLSLLNINVVALGNSLLTNVSALSTNELTNKKDFFLSIINRLETSLNVNKLIIPDHFFKEIKIDNPNEMFPNLIEVVVDEDMQMHISNEHKTFNDYTNSLKKKYKTRVKSVFKKSDAIRITPLYKKDIEKYSDKIQELFVNVHQKSAFGIVSFNTSVYNKLIDLDDPKCIVFGYFLENKLVAFSSELRDETTLYSYFIGLDYKYNRSHRIYERILYQTIKGAVENQKRRIVFGRTAAEFKSNVGARPIASKIYVYVKNPMIRFLLKPILAKIKPKRWTQRNPFV